jgi:hypothetical protein
VQPWFETHALPTPTITRLFDEALALGCDGDVCLQHYNEPLLDPRIATLAHAAKAAGFRHVYLCTNADHMTAELASRLDGVLDTLIIALYMNGPVKRERQAWLETLFTKTTLQFTGGGYLATHFSPLFDVRRLAREHAGRPCSEPLRRMIVNHRGDMLFCCDDMVDTSISAACTSSRSPISGTASGNRRSAARCSSPAGARSTLIARAARVPEAAAISRSRSDAG